MRKFLYLALFMLAGSTTFVACSDKGEDGPSVSSQPQVDAAGIYKGTWTISVVNTTLDAAGNQTVKTVFDSIYPGFVTLAAASSYMDTLTVQADSIDSLYSLTGLASDTLNVLVNISAKTTGYGFYNVIGEQGAKHLNTVKGISGEINEKGELTTAFSTLNTRSDTVYKKIGNRKIPQVSKVTTAGSYQFVGKK